MAEQRLKAARDTARPLQQEWKQKQGAVDSLVEGEKGITTCMLEANQSLLGRSTKQSKT